MTRTRLGAEARDVKFELRRDAGVFAFEGMFRRGRGIGEFRFTPNREYAALMQKRASNTIDDKMLFRLAIHDVTSTFIQDIEQLGYKNLTPEDLVDLAIHGRRWFERRRAK